MHFGAVFKGRDIHLYAFGVGVYHKVKPEFFGTLVTEFDHFTEFPESIYVKHGKRRLSGGKRFHGKVKHDRRVFADRVHHYRVAEFSSNFTKNVDRLGFELFEVGQLFFV